ncbi:MAG TPA: hypothetical protein PKW80_10770, partial [Bacteroidales bacterium]|nr:hypothetical protein [Bacteroidales bacterium]
MQTKTKALLALMVFLTFGQNVYSQCTANNSAYRYSTSTIYTPTGSWGSVTWSNGHWQPFYVWDSYIVQIRTCDASWDTQLTLYGSNTAGSSIAYSDDCSYGACSSHTNNSIIAFRNDGSAQTGHLQLNKYSCNSDLANSTTVYYRDIQETPYISGGGITICIGTGVTLTSSMSTYNDDYLDIQWGTSSGGTEVSPDAGSVTVYPTTTTTYYMRGAVKACGTPGTVYTDVASTTIIVSDSLPDTNPFITASGDTVCYGSATMLNASVPGCMVYWYTDSCGGNLLGTGDSISVTPLSATTYYAKAVNGCGSSGCSSITIGVNPVPGPVYISRDSAECTGSNILTASGGTGGTIYWQGTVSGGTSTSMPSIQQTVTNSNTYYFRARNNHCWGTQGSISVTTSMPEPVTVSGGGTYCANALLTATGGTGGTIYWQGTVSGGNSTGTPGTSQSVTSSGTYYFRAYNVVCGWGAEGAATLVVIPNAAVTSVTGTSPMCIGDSAVYTANGVVLGGGAGAWSSSNTSVATVASNATVTAVSAGTANIIYTITGGCGGTKSALKTITILPNSAVASVSGNSPLCSGSTAPYTANGIVLGSGTGAWSSSNTAVATVAVNGNVTAVAAGTANIVYTITGGCNGTKSAQQTLTVNSVPNAVTVNGGGTFCGSSPTLTADGGTGGTIYWQGTTNNGTSTATASTSQTVSVNGTYYFRALSAGGCWGPQGSASILTSLPAAVTVSGGGSTCSSRTLIASGGTGGIIYWQGTTSGGTSTASASTVRTVTSSGTYYFRALNGCGWGSGDSAVVIVYPGAGSVTVNGAGTYCGSQTLTATGGTNGTIYWQGTTSGGTSTLTLSTSQSVTSSGTYYFRAYNANCGWGTQGSVLVSIHTPSTAPTGITGMSSICTGNSPVLTQSGGTLGIGGVWYWYSDSCGGNLISSGSASVTVSPVSTTTYYVRAEGICNTTSCASMMVTVNPSPGIVTVNGAGTHCGSANLTATGGTNGIIYWQNTTSGGTYTAMPSTSQSVSSSGTYYFRAYNSCGWGTEGFASVTINPVPGIVMVNGAG